MDDVTFTIQVDEKQVTDEARFFIYVPVPSMFH
jgi:hypothetical protein